MVQKYPLERIKLIFNPIAGRMDTSPALLQELLAALQALNYISEVYLLDDASGGLESVIQEAIHRRIRLFVVCGGDGTIETAARLLTGKRATLGIIPAGTQNNIALSLGIPVEIGKAAGLLRTGQRSRIDVGFASNADQELQFLEICSVGLFSALFKSADDLQKGDLASITTILSTLATFPLANIHLVLDKHLLVPGSEQEHEVNVSGHVVLIANLPYFGMNYRLTPDSPFDDGVLDVLVFTDFSKLELVGNVLQSTGEQPTDTRILRYRASRIEINSTPTLPVQADGSPLGNTPIHIHVKRRAIAIMTGLPSDHQPQWGFLRNMNFARFFKR
jgi:diacylglycerol kinase (ATP)